VSNQLKRKEVQARSIGGISLVTLITNCGLVSDLRQKSILQEEVEFKERQLGASALCGGIGRIFFKFITLYCRSSTWISLKVLMPAVKRKDSIKCGDCCLLILF
jgi:hypothetical protein